MSDHEAAWRRLRAAGAAAAARPITGLFEAEPDRLERLSLEAAGLYIDLSKQPWSAKDLTLALDLARAADVEAARERLFSGEMVNPSEGRAALHVALRAPRGSSFAAQGEPVSRELEATREAMADFAREVRRGARAGATGKPFTAVVHIGIGGSDFGPRLVWEALRSTQPAIDLRFAANVDPAEIAQALAGLDPAQTLVVVVSKTFTTQETMANAAIARAWLRDALGSGADSHLVAVSAAPDVAQAFGVRADQIFGFRDWVGGRYSVWSAVGLSCAIALGPDVFEALLAGGAAMDDHFRLAPLEANAPVLLALAHIFNRNAMDRPVRAVVPYAQRLRLLPNFLQQLEMESNGKRVRADGRPVSQATAAMVFGDAGANVQHAFFQLMHQGSDVIPADILAVARSADGHPESQTKLLANALAQAEALMVGRSQAEVGRSLERDGLTADQIAVLAPQKTFPGNRPTSFLLMDALTPEALGALIALYEHKTFVEGVLWGINSFDQWGVELGKTLAGRILEDLEGEAPKAHDPSTAALIARLRGRG
ncbi:MAG: glucose-6-phosphate isomerase [Phenylobacterium sp.]|uniref:glucose-6-phosphate isomerase n=1 Tax=Phenylobacterium sp. TaxID=1871053 RepID=UPI00272568F1|nr:glucose-6-phosphate isomerase [Phenylobacterium sp.]MDO8901228.1 glucose-6-phosphate isomerase [Phenylobacterium sp.]